MDIDLNIKHYTNTELYSVLGLDYDTILQNIKQYIEKFENDDDDDDEFEDKLFIREQQDIISYSYDKIIKKIKNIELDKNIKKNIFDFFNDVKVKLIKDIKRIYDEHMNKQKKIKMEQDKKQDDKNIKMFDLNLKEYNHHFEKLMDTILLKINQNIYPNKIDNHSIINPIQKRIVKKIINIDTLFRENYNHTKSTDFVHKFDYSLKNVVSIRLSSIEIPNIWHMFDDNMNNNIIEISMNNFHDPIEVGNKKKPAPHQLKSKKYRIKIPSGNYTTDEFIFTMNKILWSHDEDNPGSILNDLSYSGLRFLRFNIDDLTGQTILSTIPIEETSFLNNTVSHRVNADAKPNTDSSIKNDPYYIYSNGITDPSGIYAMEYLHESFRYTINFDPDNNVQKLPLTSHNYYNSGWFLGFRKNKYHISMDESFDIFTDHSNEFTPNEHLYKRKASLKSEGVFGSNFNYYLYLIIDDYQQNKYESVITNSQHIVNTNILARLTIRSNFNTIIFNAGDDNIYKKREYFGPVSLDKMKISIMDRYGRIVDIRDNNYSFSLEIEQLYG